MVWVSPQTRESVVVDMRVCVPFTVMPSSMQMGICAMLGVWISVTAVVVVVTVIPSCAMCFPSERESSGN